MYYQYVSKSNAKTFWGCSSKTMDYAGDPAEQRIIDWFNENNMNLGDVEKTIDNWEKYIEQNSAEVRHILSETKQLGKLVTPAVVRWFLHLAIYIKNMNYPKEPYHKLIK